MPFTVRLLGLGHHNLLNKLVDDLRRQFGQPGHSSGPVNEALQISRFVRSRVQADLQLRDGYVKLLLLIFQRYRQRGEAFFTLYAGDESHRTDLERDSQTRF